MTTHPGIVTVQFDNVLNEVRPRPRPLAPTSLSHGCCTTVCRGPHKWVACAVVCLGVQGLRAASAQSLTSRDVFLLLQAWVTYGAGFNTTSAMLADVQANPGYSLAIHNGEGQPSSSQICSSGVLTYVTVFAVTADALLCWTTEQYFSAKQLEAL